jgi:histidinol-phosphate aminotransferase
MAAAPLDSAPQHPTPLHPAPLHPALKLSSNENPYLPLPAVVDAISQAAREINRYPDMTCETLISALAAKCEVAPEQVAVGNGSVALLAHILDAFIQPGDEVIYSWRSFEAYPICIAVAGAKPVPVSNTAEMKHDLPAMAAAITDKTKVILVCSPNNPTGPIVTRADFEQFLSQVPSEVLVVLDEAYVEFVRDPLAADGLVLLPQYPNLLTLRTLSKSYGLAGLRVGYAIGNRSVIAGVRATATPFGVNHLAQVAAVASLQPTAERVLAARVAAIVAERTRVVTVLRRQGWQIPDAQGNFVFLPLGSRTAEVAQAAKAAGLLVRPFIGAGAATSGNNDDANQLAEEGIRVTIADGESNNHFLRFAELYAPAQMR